MRTLGIDFGTRRIGLALSDEGGRFATPFDVLAVSDDAAATAAVLKVIEREGVERLIVGLPLNMDDSIGPAARQAADWGRRLSDKSGKPVLFVDERLSSHAAEGRLVERKRGGQRMTRGDKKKRLDAHAAAVFLQEFLDGTIGAIEI